MSKIIAPHFVGGVDQILGAPELMQLARLVARVDGLSFRSMPAFGAAGWWGQMPGYFVTGDARLWMGALRFRDGMTTLTIEGETVGGATMYAKLGGVTVGGSWSPAAGLFTKTIALSGYTAGQVLTVEIRMTGQAAADKHLIRAVYADPLSYTASAWPGVPTFTTLLDADKLNQLGAAAVWLYNRMAAVPIVPGLNMIGQLGPFADRENHNTGYPLYWTTVQRGYTQDRVFVNGAVLNPTTPAIEYQIWLDGSQVYAQTVGTGWTWLNWEAALTSIAVGARAELYLQAKVTTATTRNEWKQTRWFTFGIGAGQNGATAYPYANVPGDYVAAASWTGTALRDRLNALSATLSAAKARIDAAPHVWARGPALPRWFAQDDDTRGNLHKRFVPFFLRSGAELLVSGKDITMGFGAWRWPTGQAEVFDTWTHQHEQTLIDANASGISTTYLGTVDQLHMNTAITLHGQDLVYAEELL